MSFSSLRDATLVFAFCRIGNYDRRVYCTRDRSAIYKGHVSASLAITNLGLVFKLSVLLGSASLVAQEEEFGPRVISRRERLVSISFFVSDRLSEEYCIVRCYNLL